jgi:NAD(P)-dependent dehydrogenase (short-subunit alcohol dehydrogenase family)
MQKHLLIFGSNGALGRGVTEVLIKKDYNFISLFDIRPNQITYKNIRNISVSDLADEETVVKAFRQLKPSKDIIYLLFSTIGCYTGGKNLWETETAEFDKMINSNLKTSFLIGKYFSRLVRESAGGSILLTSAHTGLVPEKAKIPYGVSKSGVIYLTKSLALEGKAINLSANAIAPFIIDTPANREWMGKDYDFEQLIKPEEIAEVAHSIFNNFRIISGTVINLPGKLNI